jgi:flagellar biosynthetic protein FlhB
MGRAWATRAAISLAPLMGLLAIAGVALNIGQTGFILTGDKLKPKFSYISPKQGLKRIFATEGLVNLVKALLKMTIVSVVIALVMRDRMGEITTLGNISLSAAIGRIVSIAFDIAIWSAIVLFVLTAADFAWQRRKHFKDLQMTKQEVRQEMKETEGDPQIKGAIRRRRQALLNRMISAVPKADVVVTNPTHYAVALKYDHLNMGAPIVIAKGEQLLAQRIKEVARKAGVPVLEEPPLARALYAAVPVGHPIPANLFHAVAEVLAWVYSLREGRAKPWRGGSAQPQGAL